MQLLEYLTILLGCEYLSDLPYRRADSIQLAKIDALTAEDFPLAQFQAAASYLTRHNDCDSIETAKSAILAHLSSALE